MAPSGPLISAAELAAHDPAPTLLDVRYRMGGPGGADEFRAGHVPGAVYVDLDTALAGPPGSGGRHPLPDPGVFETAMRRAGVCDDHPVVVYDDWQGHAAARARWLLRHHGHAHVRLLDGGWGAWRAAGLPVAKGDEPHRAGDFRVRPGGTPVVEAGEVLAVAADGVLVDARAPERFAGETEPIDPVAGHIPGAVNVPTGRNLRDDGRFRSAAELRSVYAEVGIGPGTRVAAYCGSGVTAAHDLLALEIIGIEAALYPGSWSGWIADPTRPVTSRGG